MCRLLSRQPAARSLLTRRTAARVAPSRSMTTDQPRTQRRLAAILAADVVGFSLLMGKDEEGTLARIRSLRRKLIEPKINEHHGRIFKTTGDGFLAEFPARSRPCDALWVYRRASHPTQLRRALSHFSSAWGLTSAILSSRRMGMCTGTG